MLRKLRTATRVWKTQGFGGLAKLLFHNKRRRAVQAIDGWLIGLRRNVVEIDGCQFKVGISGITAFEKGIFTSQRYERVERTAIEEYLDPNLPVVELGGCIGVVACTTNRRLRHPHLHIVVEANPYLVPLLESNRDHNSCEFVVIEAAIAYNVPSIQFYQSQRITAGTIVSSIDGQQEPATSVLVPTTTLGKLLEARGENWKQFTLICDIEGAEAQLISNEADLLSARSRTVIIEYHPDVLGTENVHLLELKLINSGFTKLRQYGQIAVYENQNIGVQEV